MKIFVYLSKKYSPLRIFQIIEANKVIIKGQSLEFGAYKNKRKISLLILRERKIFNIQILKRKK